MATKARTEAPNAPPQESESTALASPMTDDLLRELLDDQQASLSKLELPRIKIAPGGVGFFEFPDENQMLKEFTGVILGAHDRNVLWTTKMGENTTVAQLDDENARLPECSSPDGKFGRPKQGFRHAMLGDTPATGEERIACNTCLYNKFGSGNMFIKDKNPRGKAVTNQKDVYVFIPGRRLPFRLSLSAKSLNGYEEYVQKLTKRGVPMQSIVTTFRQTIGEQNGAKFGIVTLEPGAALDGDALGKVLAIRKEFIDYIHPKPNSVVAEAQVVSADDTTKIGDDADFTVEDAERIPVGEDKPPF